MACVNLVTLVALLEYFAFGYLVGWARGKYGVKAPAITGHEVFERYFRVQQNTLELLIAFIPALWIAAQYWNPTWIAAIGAVFIIGRLLYLRGYVGDPKGRSLGFGLSVLPILALIVASVFGAVRALFAW
jgi:glutathione S-transferase